MHLYELKIQRVVDNLKQIEVSTRLSTTDKINKVIKISRHFHINLMKYFPNMKWDGDKYVNIKSRKPCNFVTVNTLGYKLTYLLQMKSMKKGN